jgi:hypothetical protein
MDADFLADLEDLSDAEEEQQEGHEAAEDDEQLDKVSGGIQFMYFLCLATCGSWFGAISSRQIDEVSDCPDSLVAASKKRQRMSQCNAHSQSVLLPVALPVALPVFRSADRWHCNQENWRDHSVAGGGVAPCCLPHALWLMCARCCAAPPAFIVTVG